MKKTRSTKIIASVLAAVMCMSTFSVCAYADFEEKNGKIYYTDDSGEYVKGFIDIDDETYYFDSKGVMKTGWLKLKSGDKYYFDKNGKMVTGFETIDGEKYYFTSNGKMKTGWLETKKGSTYYFSEKDGHALTGLCTIGNNKYYFEDSGKMHTGWKKIKGSSYYFDDLGEMVTSQTIEIDGKTYKFDKNGVAKVSTGKTTTDDTATSGKVNSSVKECELDMSCFGKSSKTVLKKSGYAKYYISRDGKETTYKGNTLLGGANVLLYMSFCSDKLYSYGFFVDMNYTGYTYLRESLVEELGYDYDYDDGSYIWSIGSYYILLSYNFDTDSVLIIYADYDYKED